MSYEELWEALDPYGLETEEAREHCDDQINNVGVDATLVLDVLKALARHDLTRQFSLTPRPTLSAYGTIH